MLALMTIIVNMMSVDKTSKVYRNSKRLNLIKSTFSVRNLSWFCKIKHGSEKAIVLNINKHDKCCCEFWLKGIFVIQSN